jgi:hypothetical protein
MIVARSSGTLNESDTGNMFGTPPISFILAIASKQFLRSFSTNLLTLAEVLVFHSVVFEAQVGRILSRPTIEGW